MTRICRFCDEATMTTDNGVDFYCSSGCRPCESKGCAGKATADSDGCISCNMDDARREAEREKMEPCDACGMRGFHHGNCPDLERNQGFEGYAEQ